MSQFGATDATNANPTEVWTCKIQSGPVDRTGDIPMVVKKGPEEYSIQSSSQMGGGVVVLGREESLLKALSMVAMMVVALKKEEQPKSINEETRAFFEMLVCKSEINEEIVSLPKKMWCQLIEITSVSLVIELSKSSRPVFFLLSKEKLLK